tara:strand:- start:3475 stop:3864 length:390 start_codon:yes stop_codon:yes gene_type:complete
MSNVDELLEDIKTTVRMIQDEQPALDLDSYQTWALSKAIYPEPSGLYYCALKLNGEAGEVAEKIGKSLRGDNIPNLDYEIAKELGDVLWYVANLAKIVGYDLSDVARINIDKLEDRSDRDVLQGEGDNR